MSTERPASFGGLRRIPVSKIEEHLDREEIDPSEWTFLIAVFRDFDAVYVAELSGERRRDDETDTDTSAEGIGGES